MKEPSVRNVRDIYSEVEYSSFNMNRFGGHNAKQNNSDTERRKVCDLKDGAPGQSVENENQRA